MIYRFTLISDEVDDFMREIQIDSEATFLDFHRAILSSVSYADDQMTSFFLCDEGWEKGQEVTLEAMDCGSDEDNYVMAETRLSELIEDEHQRLIYIFDPLTERCFFIELTEIILGKDLAAPLCTRKKGNPPAQETDIDAFNANLAATQNTEDYGEKFYGDESFDAEDFDPEGFDIAEGNPYEQDRY